jgi:phosphoribosylformylglycinamidine cyclo-ligase
MAHITGGGLFDNIPRMLPVSLGVDLEWGTWQVPPVFELIRELGNIDFDEMCHVFNMGIGMAVICAPENMDAFVSRIPGASLAGIVRPLKPSAERVRILK